MDPFLRCGQVRNPIDSPGRSRLDVAVLAAMVVLFFAPVLPPGRIPLLGDLCFLFYPWYAFARETIRNGALPLWNPYTGCGEPFMADPEHGVFYPLNVMYLILPTSTAIVVVAALHILLAGLGTYGLCRVWRVSGAGSLLAGVTYAFNSYTITKLEFPSELGTLAWFPVVLGTFIFWLRERSRRRLLLVAIAITMQFLSGFPEPLVYSLSTVALYALMVGIGESRAQRTWQSLVAPILGLSTAGAIAILLVMMQLLPTLEAMGASWRAGAADPRLDFMSIHPLAIFSLLIPSIYGVEPQFPTGSGLYWAPSCIYYAIGAIYAGLVPIAVFVAAGVLKMFGRSGTVDAVRRLSVLERMRVPFLLTSLVCFFLYSLGKYTPFFSICWHAIPLLRQFVSAQKGLLCVMLPVSCLSGIGLDWLAERADRSGALEKGGGAGFASRWGAAIVFGVMGLVAVACLVNEGQLGKAVLKRFFNLGSVDPRLAHRIPWRFLFRDALKLPVVGLVSALLLHLYVFRTGWRKTAAALLAIVAFADLWITNAYILEPGAAEVFERPSPRLPMLRPAGQLLRFHEYEHVTLDQARLAMNNMPTGNRIEELFPSGYARSGSEIAGMVARLGREVLYNSWPLVDKAFNVQPFGRLASGDLQRVLYMAARPDVPLPMRERVLSLMNCDRIVRFPDLSKFVATGRLDATELAMLNTPFPRAWVVGGVTVLGDSLAVTRTLCDGRFDPWSAALTDRTVAGVNALEDLRHGRVTHRVDRIEYRPNAVEVELETAGPGLLVLSDTWAPGWTAQVNNSNREVLKVNGAFRGVRVPEGKSTVRMTYEPVSVRIGIAVSLISFAVIAVLAAPRPRKVHDRVCELARRVE